MSMGYAAEHQPQEAATVIDKDSKLTDKKIAGRMNDSKNYNLGETVVTAQRVHKSELNTPAATTVITADDIKKAFGRDCKVESSDEITIGGCRAGVAGGSTVADDTLDTRLEAQREWFLENSGMSVIL